MVPAPESMAAMLMVANRTCARPHFQGDSVCDGTAVWARSLLDRRRDLTSSVVVQNFPRAANCVKGALPLPTLPP